jgi:alkylation response protein AidB-like acyl-CoA dehydrogenase
LLDSAASDGLDRIVISVDDYAAGARTWLTSNAEGRPPATELVWGEGSDDVSVFHDLTTEAEREHIDRHRAWQQRKSDAGYGSIDWPEEFGGAGLTPAHAAAFRRVESEFDTPPSHEAIGITMGLIAPTIPHLAPRPKRSAISRRCADSTRCGASCSPNPAPAPTSPACP